MNERERQVLGVLQDGLPLVRRPYQALGQCIGVSEAEVIACLQQLLIDGVIKRLGVVVRHRQLGYTANAMTVWDIPDAQVDAIGQRLSVYPFVTLCYRRPRRLPEWRYNLFCMIHGRDRAEVRGQVQQLVTELALHTVAHEILFSRRCFKQCGARYVGKRDERVA